MKIRDGFVVKKLAGINVVIPLDMSTAEQRSMIQLNDTGMLLWEMLQKDVDREALIDGILATYDITKEIAARDVDAFIETLRRAAVFEA